MALVIACVGLALSFKSFVNQSLAPWLIVVSYLPWLISLMRIPSALDSTEDRSQRLSFGSTWVPVAVLFVSLMLQWHIASILFWYTRAGSPIGAAHISELVSRASVSLVLSALGCWLLLKQIPSVGRNFQSILSLSACIAGPILAFLVGLILHAGYESLIITWYATLAAGYILGRRLLARFRLE
jgi:hypothetical protein